MTLNSYFTLIMLVTLSVWKASRITVGRAWRRRLRIGL